MGAPNTPPGWITDFAAWTIYKKPAVQVLMLRPGVEYVTLYETTPASGSDHENVKAWAMDPIEYELPMLEHGSLPDSRVYRWVFLDTDGKNGRGDFFAETGGVVTKSDVGNPIYLRLKYGSGGADEWRTWYLGRLNGIEHGDDGLEVSLLVQLWFSWWLDHKKIEIPRCFMPESYVSRYGLVAKDDMANAGAFYLNEHASLESRSGNATIVGGEYNWPVTWSCYANRGIPSTWLSTGKVAREFPETDAPTAYADAPCLTINVGEIFDFPNMKSNARDDTKGLNWAGRWECPAYGVNDPLRLYTVWPFHLTLGGAGAMGDGPYPLFTDTLEKVSGGAAILAGPEPENWTQRRQGDDAHHFFLDPWDHFAKSQCKWSLIQPQDTQIRYNFRVEIDGFGDPHTVWDVVDGTLQTASSPYPLYNNIDYKRQSEKELNQPHFPDARDDGHVAHGSAADGWFYVVYSYAQSEVPGNTDLKTSVYNHGLLPKRSSPMNVVWAMIEALGEYTRPPVPELDGATEYDFQPALIVPNGYEQLASYPTSEWPDHDTTEEYLVHGSRIPHLNSWRQDWHVGLNEDVLKPGATMRKVLGELATALGWHIYQAPFGQIDFEVVKAFKDSAGAHPWFWDESVHVPTFRGSTTGAAPLTSPLTERNCWDIKWKDLADKALSSLTLECGRMTYLDGRTGVNYESRYKKTTPVAYGEVDAKVSSQAIFMDPRGYLEEQSQHALSLFKNPLKAFEFETSIRFLSDDRTRDDGTGKFQRLGRPIFFTDTDTNVSAYGLLTGLALMPLDGLMRAQGHTSDATSAQRNCYKDTSSLDFGELAVGLTSDLTFTVVNDGPDTLSGTAAFDSSGSGFSIYSGANYEIASGGTHDITVRFNPTIGGLDEARLVIGSGCGSVLCRGWGAQLPICINESQLDMKTAYIGYHRDGEAEITNYGHGTLTGTARLEAEDGYQAYRLVLPDGTEVPAGTDIEFTLGHLETATLKARFRPPAEATFRCRISITANAICRSSLSINEIFLTGIGAPVPDCFVNPLFADFGRMLEGQNSGGHEIAMTNTSGDDLSGTGVLHQGADELFEIVAITPAGGASATENPDGTWDLELPSGDGNLLTLDLRCNTQGKTVSRYGFYNGILELQGMRDCANVTLGAVIVGQDGPCTADRLSMNFGKVAEEDTAELTVTLTNEEELGGPNITGTYRIAQFASSYSDKAGDGTLDIAPGGEHEITIEYTPTAEGQVDFGWLQFSTNASQECPQIGMIGTGEIVLPTCDISSTGETTNDRVLNFDSFPAVIDLQKVEHGASVVRKGVLANPSSQAVTLTLDVTNPGESSKFTVCDNHDGTGYATSVEIIVPASGTHDYAIRYESEETAYSQSVAESATLAWNGPAGCPVSTALAAMSVPGSEKWSAPEVIDFGYVEIGDKKYSRQLVLQNYLDRVSGGNLTSFISGWGSSDAFSLLNSTGTKVGSVTFTAFFGHPVLTTLNLVYEPTAEGAQADSITHDPSIASWPSQQTTIRGYGYLPLGVSLSHQQVNFGIVGVGETEESSTITITATGGSLDGAVAVKVKPAISGTQSEFTFGGSWSLSGGATGPDASGYYTLPKGASISNTAEFTPSDAGVAAGKITFGPYVEASVTLFGEGQYLRDVIDFAPNALAMNGWIGESTTVELRQTNTLTDGVDHLTSEGTVILNAADGMYLSAAASGGAAVTWQQSGEKATYSVPPGGEIVWTVIYSPKAAGNIVGTLIFTGEDLVIPISGTALAWRETKTPAELPGVRAIWHLDYEHGISDGNPITTLEDQSENANDLSQATSSRRPTVLEALLNGHDVLSFDGVDDNLLANSLRLHENDDVGECGFTFACVVRFDSSGPAVQVIASEYYSENGHREHYIRPDLSAIFEDTTSFTPYSSVGYSMTSGVWYTLLIRWKTGLGLQVFLNGVNQGTSATTITDIDHTAVDFILGAYRHGASNNLKGELAFAMASARYLSDEDVAFIHEYLRALYNHYSKPGS